MIQPNINSIHVKMNLLIYLPHEEKLSTEDDREKSPSNCILVDSCSKRNLNLFVF